MSGELIIPKKLEEAITTNNLVLFVGAGCSVPLKFPSWSQLIKDILQDLDKRFGDKSDTNFKNILNGVQSGRRSLFEALNKIEGDVDHGSTYKIKSKEIVNAQIESVAKSLPEQSVVHSLLWNISSKIITTNYDNALERYKPNNINPKIFDNTNAFQSLRSQSNDAQFLYKIHGDNDNPESIILFESDYKEIYEKDNYNNDSLATHFKDKTFLFIGFSLTDPFVNDLFTKIKTIYKGYTVNEHFVFTTKDEDFTEYDITTIPIENWNDGLLGYLTELEKNIPITTKSTNKLPVVIEESKQEELVNNDIGIIGRLLDIKTKELSNDPGNKELHKEVNDLRGKINNLMFSELDYLIEVDKPFRNGDLQSLFDVIYSSEKVDGLTLERIQKVRKNTDSYKWYDRSVIVSAITCSLIHFNKADEQKITLLLDFINDNEEKVWQKAITSLFMVLNHLGNKWLRFPSIKTKIKSLNQNSRIQDACSVIIQLFSVGLNYVSMIDENLFINPYFSDNPFNYFLPYHQEENPAFDSVYDNYTGNDIEDFIKALNHAPIPDQLKYLFCSKIVGDEESSTKNKKISAKAKNILHLNSCFYPYSIFVQEIISFYRYFPAYKHEEKLKSQLKLTETPLRDYLLNEKEKHSALGAHFMKENNWAQAIVNYKGALKVDENDVPNLLNLANCFHYNKEKEEEFSLRIKIQNKDSINENNLKGLFDLYFKEKKDYNNSLKIANKLIVINENNGGYFNFRGVSFKHLKNYDKALKDYNKAIKINPKESLFYNNRANVYYLLKDFKNSILDLNAALELDPNNDDYFYSRSTSFTEQNKYKMAIDDLNSAISINKKDYDYLITRADNYMYLSLFEEALKDIKKAEALGAKMTSVYHSYSNYYRLTNAFDKALENIIKADELKKDFRHTGTKATIYASMGDHDSFYKYLEMAINEGAEANLLYPDIKDKYKNEPRFVALLHKYKQEIFLT
jgi:tetratricopeptide (TPR) repeat protein